MSDPNDGAVEGEDESDDYIYRGEHSSPQDGEPWNPPAPPPPAPPVATPYPTSPPPGFPPQQPPMGEPDSDLFAPPPTKKKRWPWIVAAVVVLCGLPLGGCVALIGFGVNEISSRSAAIEGTVEEFFETVAADATGASVGPLVDGQPPCMPADALASSIRSLGASISWSAESTAFVERSDNSSFSSSADPETLFIDGRPGESAAFVTGILHTDSGASEAQILLSRPVSLWRICTITVR